LLAILADPAGSRRMGRAAVVRSLRFSWDATAGEMLSVYRELLDGRHHDRAFTEVSRDGPVEPHPNTLQRNG